MKLFSMNVELFSEKKIALVITQKGTSVKYEVYCLSKLTKNSARVEHRFIYILSLDDLKEPDILEKYKEKLEKDLVSVEYDKVSASIGIDLECIFIDEILIPKLSSSLMEKTLHTEIKKLYGNYEKKYETSLVSIISSNKKQVKVNLAFLDRAMFQLINSLIVRFNSFTPKVRFMPSVIKQRAVASHLIDTSLSTLFINVGEKETRLVLTKQVELLSFDTINVGYKEIKKGLKNDLSAAETELLKSIVRIIAYASEKSYAVEAIKINVENPEITEIDQLLASYIPEIPVLTDSSENFCALALFGKPNLVYDHAFNTKVK